VANGEMSLRRLTLSINEAVTPREEEDDDDDFFCSLLTQVCVPRYHSSCHGCFPVASGRRSFPAALGTDDMRSASFP
jgi:hypothetical protein